MIWHNPLDAAVVAAVSQVGVPTNIYGRLAVVEAPDTIAAHGSVGVSASLGLPANTTVLLVHCDGTSGSTAFTDASTFAHPLTASTVTVSTVSPKFGTGCASYPIGGAGTLVVGGNPADFNFGSSQFTLEAWCYFSASLASFTRIILSQFDQTSPSNTSFYFYADGSQLGFVTSTFISGAYTPPLNTWIHFAAECDATNTLRLYADGVVIASSVAFPPLNASTMPFVIGNIPSGGNPLPGFIDEVRVSRVARYGGPFTPPAAPFVPDAGGITQADQALAASGTVATSVTGSLTVVQDAQTLAATGTVVDPALGFTLIAHTGSTTPGTNSSTTAPIDTTGADLLVAVVSQYSGSAIGTVTDSKTNSWTPLTAQSGGNSYARMFYARGGPVGSGHVFSYTGGFSSFVVLAFAGSAASPFDVESGSSTTLYYDTSRPCPLTPSQDASLVVSGCSVVDGGTTPYYESTGFTTTDYVGFAYNAPDGQEGVVGGYLIQTTAAVANPTWHWTTGNLQSSAVAASFKPASGGAPSTITGTLTLTQADQTITAAGSVAYPPATGTLVVTQAPQTITASGGPLVGATLGATQAPQTITAAGGPLVGASLTQTQVAQSLVASGGAVVTATLAVTQAPQGLAGTGGGTVGATLSVTQADQTIVAAGGTRIIGTLALSQAPQTLVASGMVISGLGGALTVTQAPQTLAATGFVAPITIGSLNLAQADQTLAAAGGTHITGSLTVTQAPQTIVAAGGPLVGATLGATQDDQWMSSAVRITVGGTLAATQEDQTGVAAGIVTVGAVLALIQDSQIVVAAGSTSVEGRLAVTQAADSLVASGLSGVVIQARATMMP